MSAVLPRSFRLLEELEKGEKGLDSVFLLSDWTLGLGDGSCSYGLADGDDIMMTHWNGTILGPPHVRFLSLFKLKILTWASRVFMKIESIA